MKYYAQQRDNWENYLKYSRRSVLYALIGIVIGALIGGVSGIMLFGDDKIYPIIGMMFVVMLITTFSPFFICLFISKRYHNNVYENPTDLYNHILCQDDGKYTGDYQLVQIYQKRGNVLKLNSEVLKHAKIYDNYLKNKDRFNKEI